MPSLSVPNVQALSRSDCRRDDLLQGDESKVFPQGLADRGIMIGKRLGTARLLVAPPLVPGQQSAAMVDDGDAHQPGADGLYMRLRCLDMQVHPADISAPAAEGVARNRTHLFNDVVSLAVAGAPFVA